MKILAIKQNFNNSHSEQNSSTTTINKPMLVRCPLTFDKTTFSSNLDFGKKRKAVEVLSNLFFGYINNHSPSFSIARASAFLDNLKKAPPNTLQDFILYRGDSGYTPFDVAIHKGEHKIANKILNIVQSLDNEAQKAFALSDDIDEATTLHNVLWFGKCENQKNYLEFIKNLSESTRSALFLHLDRDFSSPFTLAASRNPNMAEEILNLVKNSKSCSAKSNFVLLKVYSFEDGNSQFQVLLDTKNTNLAQKFLELVNGLEDSQTKKEFALTTNNGLTLFGEALKIKDSDIAVNFLKFIDSLDLETIKAFNALTNDNLSHMDAALAHKNKKAWEKACEINLKAKRQ